MFASSHFNDGVLPYGSSWAWRLQGLLRIVTAYLLLQHGTSKLFGWPHVPMFDNLELFSLLGLAGSMELVGGVLLFVGVYTRPVAFVMAGELAAAYFVGHVASKGKLLMPLLNGGELAVLFCFVLLLLSVAGAGAFSIDAVRRRRSRHQR